MSQKTNWTWLIQWDFYLLTLSQTSPGFYVSAVQGFWKHCGKGGIAHNEQFFLFPQCFLPIWRTLCHFHGTWNCRLQTLPVWKSLKFLVGERVKGKKKKRRKRWKMPAASYSPFLTVLSELFTTQSFLLTTLRNSLLKILWEKEKMLLSFLYQISIV